MSNGQSITRSAGRTGRKASITSAVALGAAGSPKAKLGIKIYNDTASATVYYGFADTITRDSADATDGFPIPAGKTVLVRCNDPSLIYVTAGSTSKVWWEAL